MYNEGTLNAFPVHIHTQLANKKRTKKKKKSMNLNLFCPIKKVSQLGPEGFRASLMTSF